MASARPPHAELPLPLLVTGVAGVAGYNAFRTLQSRFPGQVIGVRQVDNWPLSGNGIVACNSEDHLGLMRLFDQYQFKSVLNCAWQLRLKACEMDSRLACALNVESIINLLSVIVDRPVRLVHLSIDLVYSGIGNGAYRESDLTDPVTVYGKTMVASEKMIQDCMPSACTLRISLPMGVSFNGHAGAIDWIQSRFQKAKPATLYYDEIRCPAYTDCLNRLFESVLIRGLSGLYHAGGPRPLSLFQIAQIVNRVGGYDPRLLIGCPRADAGPMPPRAGNVTLNSSRLAQALGHVPLDPWPWDDEFMPTHGQWHYERSGESGSPELLARALYRNPALTKAP